MTHGICEHCGGCQCCDECTCEEYTHTPSGGKFWIVHNRMHDCPYTERDQAVADAADQASDAMMIALLYGGSSLGVVHDRGGPVGGTWVIRITAATWAPGVWHGELGSKVDAWSPDMATRRTVNAPLTITSLDEPYRAIHVTGDASDITHVEPGDCIVPYQSRQEVKQDTRIPSIAWGKLWL